MSCCSDELVKWVTGRRWYPFKGVLPDEMITFKLGRGVIGVLLRVRSREVFAPILVTDSEFTEGEYSAEYVRSLVEKSAPLDIELIEPVPADKISVKPLLTTWTNVLSIVETESLKYVLKGYRTLSAGLNEPKFLKYLTKVAFPYSPELVMEAMLGDATVAVMTKFIESMGDGGSPFYMSALKYYRSGELDNVLEYATRLGNVIALFHKVMNACDEEWCAPRIATENEVKTWLNDIELQISVSREFLNDLSKDVGVNVGDVVSEALDKLRQEFKYLNGLKLIRTHGDLHLAQTLYTGEDFFLIDFEGEPNRTLERKRVLETASRDLACIARSLHYIAMTSLAKVKRLSMKELFKIFIKKDLKHEGVDQWLNDVFTFILNGYLRNIELREIQSSPDTGLFLKSLDAWIIERALYELVYELNYGTGYVYVPLIYLLSRI